MIWELKTIDDLVHIWTSWSKSYHNLLTGSSFHSHERNLSLRSSTKQEHKINWILWQHRHSHGRLQLMTFFIMRSLLYCSLIVSTIFLYFSVFLTDACYTVPCLSSAYSLNFLRVSVSASVSAVVFGTVNLLAPSGALYLIYIKCKSFSGGVLNGIYVFASLAAWIQAITWGEQYSNLQHLSSDSILMFGSAYQLNTALRRNSLIMCFLCAISALLNTTLCLLLLRTRELYCVDHLDNRVRRIRPTYHQYQTVSVSDNRDGVGSDDVESNEVTI